MQADGQAAHGALHFAELNGVARTHGVGGGPNPQALGDGAFNFRQLDAVRGDDGADDAG